MEENKTFAQYKKLVVSRARRRFWDARSVLDVVINLIITSLSVVIVGIAGGSGGELVIAVIIPLLISLAIYALIYAHYVDTEAVRIHNERQEEINKLQEELRRRSEQPQFEIFYDNDDPLCRHIQEPNRTTGMRECYIRLKIINNENMSAKNCVGRLETIADVNGKPYSDWSNSPLAWETKNAGEPCNLNPKGDYKYLDIGQIVQGEPKIILRTDRRPRGTTLDRPPGRYYLHIVVDADGYEPAKQWFEVSWDDGEYDNFKMSKVESPQMLTAGKA